MKTSEYNETLMKLRGMIVGESIRVPVKIARALLLDNPSHVIGGNVFGFTITSLGLGICSVKLHPGCGVIMAKRN